MIMKNLLNIRTGLMAFIALVLFACASGRTANTGTASDRTGVNGATNGTGKAPRGNSHNLRN